MKQVVLLSTYPLPSEEQWDMCRMLEQARISHFEFIVLQDRKGSVQDLQIELEEHKELPILLTLDATAFEFAQTHLQYHGRILDWYRPSLSYLPPKVNGQQLANLLYREATQPEECE
jgi:hypothetical protein